MRRITGISKEPKTLRHWAGCRDLRTGLRLYLAVASIAGWLVSCNITPKSGADVLTTTADLISAGKGSEAAKLVGVTRPIVIKDVDPSDPAFCSTDGFKYRLDNVGYQAAQTLVQLDREHADKVTQFAIATAVFNSKMAEQDNFVSELCVTSAAQAQVDYMTARGPLGSAMQTILTDLQAGAEGQVGKPKLDGAVKAILAQRATDAEASSAADCAERKAHPRKPQIGDPPILAQANEMIRESCERAGH